MTVKDFNPYDFESTLKKALEMGPNLMLKLPNNMDIEDLISVLLRCYLEKSPQFIQKNQYLDIQIEEFYYFDKKKYYMILTGNIVWKDTFNKINQIISQQNLKD